MVAERRKQDPVPAFEAVLIEHGIATAGDVDAMQKYVLARRTRRPTRPRRCRILLPSDIYTNLYEGAWQPWQS